MGPFGPTEILIILVIALVVFGPKRLPEMGKSLGKGIREFKSSVTGDDEHPQQHAEPQVTRTQELPPAAPAPAPVAPPPAAVAVPVPPVQAAPHGDAGTPR
jgi:sec-independent protein translocase protein TatA